LDIYSAFTGKTDMSGWLQPARKSVNKLVSQQTSKSLNLSLQHKVTKVKAWYRCRVCRNHRFHVPKEFANSIITDGKLVGVGRVVSIRCILNVMC